MNTLEILGFVSCIALIFLLRWLYCRYRKPKTCCGIEVMDDESSKAWRNVYKGLADNIIQPPLKAIGINADLKPILLLDADRVVYVDVNSILLLGNHTLDFDAYAVNTSIDTITCNHLQYRINHKKVQQCYRIFYHIAGDRDDLCFDNMIRHAPKLDKWMDFDKLDKVSKYCIVYAYSFKCKK